MYQWTKDRLLIPLPLVTYHQDSSLSSSSAFLLSDIMQKSRKICCIFSAGPHYVGYSQIAFLA